MAIGASAIVVCQNPTNADRLQVPKSSTGQRLKKRHPTKADSTTQAYAVDYFAQIPQDKSKNPRGGNPMENLLTAHNSPARLET